MRWAATWVLWLAAPSTIAQSVATESLGDLTLEQLVAVQLVSAPSKRPESARESPAVVTVVSSETGRPFLQKPFTAQKLAKKIRETLDQGSPAIPRTP